MPIGPDDPLLTSKPGYRAPKGILSQFETVGTQHRLSGWMNMLRDARETLQRDPADLEALQVMAEFQSAMQDPAANETIGPGPLAKLWQGAKDIFHGVFDWGENVVGGLATAAVDPPTAIHGLGQATGIGNWGGVIDMSPKPDRPTWGWSAGMPGYGSPSGGPVTSQEFRDASVPEKLERIVQALPTNVPYNAYRKLAEGTGFLGMLPWNQDEPQTEPVGTRQTTQDALDVGSLAFGLGEAGGLPAIGKQARAQARAVHPRGQPTTKPLPVTRATGRGIAGAYKTGKHVVERVKAGLDLIPAMRDKLRATAKTEAAREAEVTARADWHKARTEAQNIKNQGGTPQQKMEAKIRADLADVRLKQAQEKLKVAEQEAAQAVNKGKIVGEEVTRAPISTRGVELSNELKQLRIDQMKGKAAKGAKGADEGAGPTGAIDDVENPWEGLVDEGGAPPAAPAPKPPKPPKKPKVTPKAERAKQQADLDKQMVAETEKILAQGGPGALPPIDAPVHPPRPPITPAKSTPLPEPPVQTVGPAISKEAGFKGPQGVQEMPAGRPKPKVISAVQEPLLQDAIPAAKVGPGKKVTPKSKLDKQLEQERVRSQEKIDVAKVTNQPSKPMTPAEMEASRAGTRKVAKIIAEKKAKGPSEPVAPEGAEPKTPHPDDVPKVSARKVPPRAQARAIDEDVKRTKRPKVTPRAERPEPTPAQIQAEKDKWAQQYPNAEPLDDLEATRAARIQIDRDNFVPDPDFKPTYMHGKPPEAPKPAAPEAPKVSRPEDAAIDRAVQTKIDTPASQRLDAAIDKVAQEAQAAAKGPTRTVEPPKTKQGTFEHPPFNEDLNIAQSKKWPPETEGNIQSYLDEIKKNIEYVGEEVAAAKQTPVAPVNAERAAKIARAEAAAKPPAKPKITRKQQETPEQRAAREADEAEQSRLEAEAERAAQRKAAKEERERKGKV